MIQVSASPLTVEAMLKSRLCEKKSFPYGDNENVKYYDPHCIEDMYICQDFCGKRCQNKCKIPHKTNCPRGKLPDLFLNCPSRLENSANLEYISYGLREDTTVKEGKATYKKMEKIKEGLSFTEFIERFHKDFKSYSKHKIESWILTTIKNTSTTPKSQNPSTLFCISDFAQNIKLSTKKETSEEYFHKRQIALF